MMSQSKRWVTHPYEEVSIAVSQTGYAAKTPKTIVECLMQTVEKFGAERALCLRRPVDGKLPENWTIWTWNDYFRDCRSFAKSLIFLGLQPFSIINILGFNSPEWIMALNGSILAGCIGAGIYSTNMAEACYYISDHSKAKVVVLDNNKQLAKYTQIASRLPHLTGIVMWEEAPDPVLVEKCGKPVYSWEEFLKLGCEVSDAAVDERAFSVKPGNCASLIYTSGTTGPPKSVMISHDNLTWTGQNLLDHYVDMNHEARIISYLPLSHIAAQLIDIFCIMFLGGSTWFAQPDALKGTLTLTMKQVRPTFFFGVPRVWEKMQEKIIEIGRQSTGIKKSLAIWAKSCGMEKNRLSQYGAGGGTPWGYGCANSLILSKIKEALGLDHATVCFTGAAPISTETLWFFASLDIPIYELFGQSECTGPQTVSCSKAWKIGYCGRPLKGSESKIDSTTGELLYRGRHIFMGYMYMEKETRDTIDDDGFLHSGDVGEFDNNDDVDVPKPSGFMKITGRIKELIITAGGENIPPVLIENEMKSNMIAISNCMVIGDRRKFLSMLISLKVEVDVETGLPTDKLATDSLFVAQQIGSNAKTYTEAKADPLFKQYIDNGIKAGNTKTTSNAQHIQKWIWLPEDFCERNGDLTPTLKLKRKIVATKYADLIESIYE